MLNMLKKWKMLSNLVKFPAKNAIINFECEYAWMQVGLNSESSQGKDLPARAE